MVEKMFMPYWEWTIWYVWPLDLLSLVLFLKSWKIIFKRATHWGRMGWQRVTSPGSSSQLHGSEVVCTQDSSFWIQLLKYTASPQGHPFGHMSFAKATVVCRGGVWGGFKEDTLQGVNDSLPSPHIPVCGCSLTLNNAGKINSWIFWFLFWPQIQQNYDQLQS